MEKKYPCPCCGYLVHNEPPGSYSICPICFWEDDFVQLGFPVDSGGANRLTLYESQREFLRLGVCEARFAANVRPPSEADERDPKWRPFDPARDPHLIDSPHDTKRWLARDRDQEERLYYWRDDYWLLDR